MARTSKYLGRYVRSPQGAEQRQQKKNKLKRWGEFLRGRYWESLQLLVYKYIDIPTYLLAS